MMTDAEMQRGETAHREPDNMRLRRSDMFEYCKNVVGRARLRIGGNVGRHIRRRKAAGVEGDGTVALAEMPHLRLVTAKITRKFMNEDHRMPRSGFLEIKPYTVVGCRICHRGLLKSAFPYTAKRTGSRSF